MSAPLRTVALLLLLGAACAVLGDPLPLAPHRAEYLLTRDGLAVADLVMELEATADGGYRYHSETRPHRTIQLIMHLSSDVAAPARVVEESRGRPLDGRFRPDHYRHLRENEDGRTLTVTFDWPRESANMLSEGRPWRMDVPPDAQDKLSVLLALRLDLARGVPELTYPVADGGKLKDYRYRRTGEARIDSALGPIETITLSRTKNDGPVDYRLWVAAELNHVPVRVERSEGGALWRMELTRLVAPGAD
jgi:hypothetical protein